MYNKTIPQEISYIGAQIGQCGNIDGCQDGPEFLKNNIKSILDKMSKVINAQNIRRKKEALPFLVDFSKHLSLHVQETIKKNKFPFILGGDHSCAIGTWSPFINLYNQGKFGLIWIDAHFDLHTVETSKSKNLHGTSAASLLGFFKEVSLLENEHYLHPKNLFFIGTRSFEIEEEELAEKLGIKVYPVLEVQERGFDTCLNEVIDYFQNESIPYGVSFDLDVIDPNEAFAVGTPVENGIDKKSILNSFRNQDFTGIQGLEIVEYNPRLDKNNQTFILVKEILSCFDKAI